MPAPRSLLKGFERVVATAEPDPSKRLLISDPDTRGLFLRIMPSGHKSFTVVARNPDGKQVWVALGDCAAMPLTTARSQAGECVGRIKAGLPPFPEAKPDTSPETFGALLDSFLVRYVDKQELRTSAETKRIFKTYVLPKWEKRPISEIKRGDVARLLDHIEDANGPVMADRVLAAVSKMLNWHMSREDDYISPVSRGMRRSNGRERARSRFLNDDEIKLVWTAAAASGPFGGAIQIAILTAQRKTKVQEMKWDDLKDGMWHIPIEPREKSNAGRLPLTAAVLNILQAQRRIPENPYVFAGRGSKPISGYSKMKIRLDAAITEANGGVALPGWRLHDLRRTAKSLMTRAGVRRDVSERVLGHVIPGVEGVYDRHDYLKEKGEALAQLSDMLMQIVSAPAAAPPTKS